MKDLVTFMSDTEEKIMTEFQNEKILYKTPVAVSTLVFFGGCSFIIGV